MDYAAAVSPVRGPESVGELASLARQALMPRTERVEQALRMREMLQEVAPERTSDPARTDSERQPRGDALSQRVREYTTEPRTLQQSLEQARLLGLREGMQAEATARELAYRDGMRAGMRTAEDARRTETAAARQQREREQINTARFEEMRQDGRSEERQIREQRTAERQNEQRVYKQRASERLALQNAREQLRAAQPERSPEMRAGQRMEAASIEAGRAEAAVQRETQPRLEGRAEQPLEREGRAELPLRETDAAAIRQENNETPDRLRPRQVPSIADLTPLRGGLRGDLPPGRDGDQLREVAAELRSLREDIRTMSRMLGFTSRDYPDFQGVLQQHDRLDSDVRAGSFREDSAVMDVRGERRELRVDTLQREVNLSAERLERQREEISQLVRENEVRRIARRQDELVRALRRAERRLEEVPRQELPVGLRDQVIGEIYRARYSVALFGGAQGMAQLNGLGYAGSM